MLEDNRIKVFKAVVAEGNFTRAARSLGVTQPAVSQIIAELEKESGAVLFIRERNGVRLTPEGTVFLRYADALVRDYAALSRVFDPANPFRRAAPVRVSAPLFVQEQYLAPVFEEMGRVGNLRFACTDAPDAEADMTFTLVPARGTLDLEEGSVRIASFPAAALTADAGKLPVTWLVWAPYYPLLSPAESDAVVLSSDSLPLLLGQLSSHREAGVLMPLPAVPSGPHLLPVPFPHLSLDVRMTLPEHFARTRTGRYILDRLSRL